MIDDDSLVRYTMSEIRARDGHEILEASQGEEGIAICEIQPVDLIITDIIMPRMDGIETISKLVKEYPSVPIIAISGGGRLRIDVPLDLAAKLGATRTLYKPIKVADLIGVVRECLDSRPSK